MRNILALGLIILFLVMSGSSATSWPTTGIYGPPGGFTNRGPITAQGFYATATPTDIGYGTNNGWGQISIQTIAAAETSDDDQCWTGIPANNTTNFLLRSSAPKGTPVFLAQPDVPRNIICTPSGSATGQVKITGTDIASAAITENLTLNGAGVVASTKAFKTVTRLDGSFTQETARTLKIGTGDLLGLNQKLTTNTVLFCALGGTREATAPAVTVSSTVISLNTIDTSSAPGGAATKVWMVIS